MKLVVFPSAVWLLISLFVSDNPNILIGNFAGLIVMLITYHVIPILKSKYGNNKVLEAHNTFNAILHIAEIAVEAVEQMNGGKKGVSEKKLEDATNYAKEMLGKYNITYNDMELRAAIEQAVKKMNAAVVETPENVETLENAK